MVVTCGSSVIAFLRSNLYNRFGQGRSQNGGMPYWCWLRYNQWRSVQNWLPACNWKTSPAGEQAQGKRERLFAGCVLSRYATHIWCQSASSLWHGIVVLALLINPRLVQRRWRIASCFPFPRGKEEEGLLGHLRWETHESAMCHCFMSGQCRWV